MSTNRLRRTLERAEKTRWVARRLRNQARFRRQQSGWLDPYWSGDDGSNLNLFATGSILIHKGRKP
jgi:hypothetical protein